MMMLYSNQTINNDTVRLVYLTIVKQHIIWLTA